MSIGNILPHHARFRPNHTALICGDQRLTYRELNQSVNRVANAIRASGIRKGDKVAMLLPNCRELWELYWAIAKLGAISVPLSPLLMGHGLRNQLNDADTALLVTTESVTDHIDPIFDALHLRREDVWLIDTEEYHRYDSFYRHKHRASKKEPPATAIHPDDLYNIIYSSGTTGEPKGIMLTHRIRAAYMTLFGSYYRMTPECVVLHSGSIIFNGSFLTTMPVMFLGGTFILHENFDAADVVRTIKAERVTHTILVPSQIVAVIEQADFKGEHIESLEMILSAGAPLHQKHKEEINRRIPGAFYELYGLTEGFVTILDKTDFHKKPGSVGCSPQFFDMRIRDDEGRDLPPGEVGEIVGRGPILMAGYYKDPMRTRDAIRDGWLYSGDLGYVDEDGYLFLADRKKDMVISGGVNIYPKDIEEVVIGHPEVREAAVFGVPDESWGEALVAAVMLKPSSKTRGDELVSWVNERVDARFHKLKAVYIMVDFPRNVAGKTLKREIKRQYLGSEQRTMDLTDPNPGNKATDRFLEANNIQLHYIHHEGLEPPLILMPGLTANAHSFDAILNAGVRRAVLAVDLRGRGLSDKPAHGYTMEDHAADIIGMLDRLGIESTVIGGHSFGGLLSIYLASHYPHRVEKIIIIDAAARMHPNIAEMVRPALSRLGKQWPSFSDYLEEIKSAPYLKDKWLPEMESYYRADVVKKTDDGIYTTHSSPEHIIDASRGAIGAGIDWLEYSSRITQQAILINAVENYSDEAPILPQALAMETVDRLEACQYIAVPGNHLTMLYGEGAREIAKAIDNFSAKPT